MLTKRVEIGPSAILIDATVDVCTGKPLVEAFLEVHTSELSLTPDEADQLALGLIVAAGAAREKAC